MSVSLKPRSTRQRPWWHVRGRHSSWPYLTLLGMVLGGLGGLLWSYNPVAWNLASQASPRQGSQVMLVDIDAGSLADYGPVSTWNMDMYRTVISHLQDAGAKAVGLDVLLDPAKPDAAPLNEYLAGAGVVQAAQPDWASPAGTQGLYGLSVLNRSAVGGAPYSFQPGYRSTEGTNGNAAGEILPSFAWQLAHAAGSDVPLSTQTRFLHHFEPSVLETRLSLRDVMTGRFRYADIQGKVVVIGQASGDALRPTGSELQARAVSTLLAQPYLMFPAWVVGVMSALLTGLSVVLGRYWGLLLAVLMPPLMLVLWPLGVALPGLTLTVAALLGLTLVGLESWLARRRAATGRVSLSEKVLGSRAGLSQAVEVLHSSSDPGVGQPCLFLVQLRGYRSLEESFGIEWAEEGLDQGLARLIGLGETFSDFTGLGFRWDDGEVVFIVDPVEDEARARDIAAYLAQTLGEVVLRGQPLQPWVGYAWIPVRGSTRAAGETTAPTLIETARQNLRPAPNALALTGSAGSGLLEM